MDSAKIYQDNKSAILLEKNWKYSNSKRTKHIKQKFFFITNKIEDGKVNMEYKPTGEIWTDINTKPKKGKAFQIDWSKMMNCPVDLPANIDVELA